MSKTGEIFTIGHSTHAIETFLKLLKQHQVEALADVRRWPTSKKFPQFTRDSLSESLWTVAIEYHWFGEDLGGYRTGGYEQYTTSVEFQRGLAALVDLAQQKRVAIMCAEAVYFKCHRRFISDRLTEKGWRVWHIFPDGRLYEHKQRDLFTKGEATG
jgi:uncharacterized protein (DUF488 family)